MFVPEFGHIPVVRNPELLNERTLRAYRMFNKYPGEILAVCAMDCFKFPIMYWPKEEVNFDPWE